MDARLRIAMAVCLAVIAGNAYAQDATERSDERTTSSDLSTITVVGTRTERTLKEVAATISILTAEDIEREVTRDIADLIRYEPGVSVSGTGSRFGLSGFTIRGIGGNRVLTMVDGIRIPDEFSFGPFLSARRDFVDVDSLERAEIARGPISSLYGSDAMGGVVALTTKSPLAYVDPGKPYHLGLKAGYSGADASTVGTISLAGGGDRLSALLLYTNRDGAETETQGSVGGTGPTRERADPLDLTSDNVVGKLAFAINETNTLTVGVDYFDSETDARLLSDYGIVSFGTLINQRDAVDTRERTRVSLHYEYDGDSLLADQVLATIYDQSSETEQLTLEARTTPAQVPQNRRRLSVFEQDIQGAYVQLSKSFDAGSMTHRVTYGLDYYVTDNAGLRDGGTFDTAGAPVPEFLPLPTRDFPLTETELLAFFLQDEISLLDDRLLITPGLRYDSFDANASADAIYLNGNPGSPLPEDYDDSELTGRIGVVYAFTDVISGYVQYSEGFRAPPYDDVNVGFTNFVGGYKTISNPDLRSERSEGLELGLRVEDEIGSASIGVFQTDYDDFIESFAISPQFLATGGIDPADNLLTFQSINREQVTIEGVEFAGYLNLGAISDGLDGFALQAALAYAKGEDEANGQPINSIEPLSGVFGIAYSADNDRWGGELVWTVVEGKDESDIDENSPRPATSGYGILDLLAYASLTERLSVNVGLFNLTDKTYTRWADTGGIGNDAPARFTQPGFNAAANIRWEF
ncbi:MAG: TonB-dependent hemoglobin/transferrin/lactoferrin family receptor [Pseudomonadota bacterium]